MVNNKVGSLLILWCLFVIGCGTKEDYKKVNTKVLEDKIFVLIGANWCSPCQKMKKDLNYYNIPYTYIEYSEDNKWVASLDIKSLPTYLLLDNKKIVKRQSGYKNISDIISFLSE